MDYILKLNKYYFTSATYSLWRSYVTHIVSIYKKGTINSYIISPTAYQE